LVDSLVTTDWLAPHLGASRLKTLDATWFHPKSGRTGRTEYDRGHIPTAVFFDIDAVADQSSSLPHMLPSREHFEQSVSALGIENDDHVVVYDRSGGGAAAARVWWTFQVFGYQKVSLLDGGWNKWEAEGLASISNIVSDSSAPGSFVATPPNWSLVRNKAQLLWNLKGGNEQVIDARSPGRFAGREDEPWPHRKVGHIPGSLNLPWNELLDPVSMTFLPLEELRARFSAAGLTPHGPIVATCGSGVTASVLAFALHLLGHSDIAVYDGSWAEWGLAEDTPVAIQGNNR